MDGVQLPQGYSHFEVAVYFLPFSSQKFLVLNGQHSKWAPVLAGVPQGSILGPLLFLIYINDLPDNLESLAKLFADDTSLFSTVRDPAKCTKVLNDHLLKVSNWAFKWKMIFNPDITKQAQEVIFFS